MPTSSTVVDLKKSYETFAFIHQVLTQRQTFYAEEFEIAGTAARTVTELANKIADQIRELEAPKAEETSAPTEPGPEAA